jgi:hypothetical protein
MQILAIRRCSDVHGTGHHLPIWNHTYKVHNQEPLFQVNEEDFITIWRSFVKHLYRRQRGFLVHGREPLLQVGVVLNPFRGELFTALKNQGAFFRNEDVGVSGDAELEEQSPTRIRGRSGNDDEGNSTPYPTL